MSCIEVNHLSKSYGLIKAVDDIVLSVKPGQVFGFLGPNGAGKSTTIKLLTTLIPPSNGSLTILGIDAIKNPLDIRHKIGVVLQQPSYEPTLSVEKSLDKYGMMWNVTKTERKKRMEQLLKDFDLVEIRKKRNEDLSIGQRRRVQVAREFMHDMDLLFLDEPTVGLDPSARRKLLDYLKNKVKTGLTIFYTTHILTEAEYLCDEIAIIDKGKIITVDSPEALKNKFGKEKTIKIHLLEKNPNISDLLNGISDCKINFDSGTNIVIHSEQSELVLLKVLKILNDNSVEIEDLSAVPTNLEEIFLKMVRDNASDY
ncbi:Nod factor export ATP-binding protein I [Marine Group I thaumarchaeote SCGC AAA799-B03]|uniref:Nod factor export ATP-binding protein I n=5 Tax=Marine Group I TaxID=905826 RepID=A0A087S942_9ARCH|nr:Nod factor export ATP-binding protein I [Marine Group I thaumarchaeote SCGC AAA799-N04]KFM14500.1 Nod factor export ATP-binding protein I [Marine Group I thaumarchaeote SCGC AAA799-D11]KFM22246.1 Nod factor export ATP-binding protein I [Marine Group I thaumarchaeote SCGC AAA799-B03]